MRGHGARGDRGLRAVPPQRGRRRGVSLHLERPGRLVHRADQAAPLRRRPRRRRGPRRGGADLRRAAPAAAPGDAVHHRDPLAAVPGPAGERVDLDRALASVGPAGGGSRGAARVRPGAGGGRSDSGDSGGVRRAARPAGPGRGDPVRVGRRGHSPGTGHRDPAGQGVGADVRRAARAGRRARRPLRRHRRLRPPGRRDRRRARVRPARRGGGRGWVGWWRRRRRSSATSSSCRAHRRTWCSGSGRRRRPGGNSGTCSPGSWSCSAAGRPRRERGPPAVRRRSAVAVAPRRAPAWSRHRAGRPMPRRLSWSVSTRIPSRASRISAARSSSSSTRSSRRAPPPTRAPGAGTSRSSSSCRPPRTSPRCGGGAIASRSGPTRAGSRTGSTGWSCSPASPICGGIAPTVAALVTFSTGAPRPQTTFTGTVVDWSSGRPAAVGAGRRDPAARQSSVPGSGRFVGSLQPRAAAGGRVRRPRGARRKPEPPRRPTRGVRQPPSTARTRQRAGAVGLRARHHPAPDSHGHSDRQRVGHGRVHPVARSGPADPAVRGAGLAASRFHARSGSSSVLPRPVDDSLNAKRPAPPDSAPGGHDAGAAAAAGAGCPSSRRTPDRGAADQQAPAHRSAGDPAGAALAAGRALHRRDQRRAQRDRRRRRRGRHARCSGTPRRRDTLATPGDSLGAGADTTRAGADSVPPARRQAGPGEAPAHEAPTHQAGADQAHSERPPPRAALGGPAAARAGDPGAAAHRAAHRGGGRRPRIPRGRPLAPGRSSGELGGRRSRAAVRSQPVEPPSGAQRHRGGVAHQPRPRAARARGGRRHGGGRGGIQQPGARSRHRHAGQPQRPLPRAASRRDRGRGRAGGQQRGGRAAAGAGRARGRTRGDHLARRADRDRRVLPDSRHPGPERRPASRSRYHQPHPPRRLSEGARRRASPPCSPCIAPTSSSVDSSPRPDPAELAALCRDAGVPVPGRRGQRPAGRSLAVGTAR